MIKIGAGIDDYGGVALASELGELGMELGDLLRKPKVGVRAGLGGGCITGSATAEYLNRTRSDGRIDSSRVTGTFDHHSTRVTAGPRA